MRIDTRKVLDFAREGDTITTIDALTRGVYAAVAGVGVSSIAVNLISQPGRDRRPGVLLAERTWRRWAREYADHALASDDPALRMLREQTRPFTWTEARAKFRSPQAERVMEACREFTGLGDALVAPVRDADGALLSVTFAGETLDLDFDARSALLLAGIYYATRSREILSGFELQAECPLTPRLLDCLRWVHVGKTDREIAMILGTTPSTVHNQIEDAKRRLGVSRRHIAARLAWSRGWFP